MSTAGRVIAGIVVTPFVVLAVVIGGCEGRKAYYDRQLREMCEKDGGARILRRVVVTPEQAASLPRHGSLLSVSEKASAKATDPVYFTTTVVQLRAGSPELARSESRYVMRGEDDPVAIVVFYSRRGGDPPTFAQPSSFSCPAGETVAQQIASIYRIEERTR